MNRFTKDMATIDDMLPLVLFDLIQVFNTMDGVTSGIVSSAVFLNYFL